MSPAFCGNTKLEAQGPFTAHLITNSKQFSQKKDNQNERIQINACVVSMLLWTFGLKEDFVKGEALRLPLPIFASP